MKHKSTLAVTLALLTIGLSSAAAHADTVTFQLTEAKQSIEGTPGGTLTYDVTASAPSANGAPVYLNGDYFYAGGQLILDDTDFTLDAPPSLNPGDSETFDLFTITVPAGTTPGIYSGTFTIVGGAPGDITTVLATVPFVTVVTPEPGSFILLGSGLAGLVGVVRRRRLL